MPHKHLLFSFQLPARFRLFSLGLWLAMAWVGILPAHAQISDAKVEALVEALRLAAPPTQPESGLYSDWRVKPENIKSWSMRCLNQEVTPEQFAADEALARYVLSCVMGPVLRDELMASQQNEIIAIQRAAAWWLTADPGQYRSGATSDYTFKVLEAYLRFF